MSGDCLQILISAALAGDVLAVRALYDYALDCGRTEQEARAIGNRVWQRQDGRLPKSYLVEDITHGIQHDACFSMVAVYGNDPSPWLDAMEEI